MSSSKLTYRAEIDGLRAVAVVSVILYHAEMIIAGRDWFQGGFVGVDIFFVISGYLITRIILSELQETGSFSFLNFYERRARRILPMLFTIIIACIPFAWMYLLPAAFVEFAQSILASLFFSSNFFFYFSTTEYGADSALLKPLLHTWSLGVEEQFYLLFPVIAIAAFRLFKKSFLVVILVLSWMSLGFAQYMTGVDTDLNFYLPFSRFWEMAVGSVLAYRELNFPQIRNKLVNWVLPVLGLMMVCYSVFAFTNETPHPSVFTLIPVVGVALIIGFSNGTDLVGRVLAFKPFVWIGLISYSAYLWHFPIFAFARMKTDPTNLDKMIWIVATFILSIISYFAIESVFRKRSRVPRLTFNITLGIGLAGILAFCAVVLFTNGASFRYPPRGMENFELNQDVLKEAHWEIVRSDEVKDAASTPVEGKTNVLIFGNSHSIDMFDGLYLARDKYPDYHFMKFGEYEQLSCMNVDDDRYQDRRDRFYGSEAYKQADVILIATRFKNAKCNSRHNGGVGASDYKGLDDLLKKLRADKKGIILSTNTAEIGMIDDNLVSDHFYLQATSGGKTVTHSDFLALKDEAEKTAYTLVDQDKEKQNREIIAKYCRADDLVCFDRFTTVCDRDTERCVVFDDDGYKLRYDYGHMTREGKIYLSKRLVDIGFEQVLDAAVEARAK